MTTTDTTAETIRAAQQAAHDARAAFEQTVRDAVHSGAASPSDVARALGTRNRQRVYAILGRGADGGTPTQPAMTPVVYLRGQGIGQEAWTRIEQAMWARGWATTHHRTDAWHLARGGAPVVLCDFSADLDRTEGPWFGYHRYVRVGRVRARYDETPEVTTVGEMLPTAELARRMREGAEWLNVRVETTVTEMGLPLINGGEDETAWRAGRLDEQYLALLVARAFND